jgi:hypothetical protein
MDDSTGLAIEQDGEQLHILSNYYTGFHEGPLMFMDLVAGSKYNDSLFIVNGPGT